jgi:uncharacterized protein (UPF0218 family)
MRGLHCLLTLSAPPIGGLTFYGCPGKPAVFVNVAQECREDFSFFFVHSADRRLFEFAGYIG